MKFDDLFNRQTKFTADVILCVCFVVVVVVVFCFSLLLLFFIDNKFLAVNVNRLISR